MIVVALITFALFVLGVVFTALPIPGVPGWLYSAQSPIQTVFGAVDSMSVWFPGVTVITVIGAVFLARMAGLTIKLARMALSLFTGGGGHAGG